jgi:hypothetical protein
MGVSRKGKAGEPWAFLLSAKAYATVESSEYPPLGAAYEKELMPIDGDVNGKVLYNKEPDQG